MVYWAVSFIKPCFELILDQFKNKSGNLWAKSPIQSYRSTEMFCDRKKHVIIDLSVAGILQGTRIQINQFGNLLVFLNTYFLFFSRLLVALISGR